MVKIIQKVQKEPQKRKKNGMKIITIGVGTEKGGPIPLKRKWRCGKFPTRQNDEVVDY
jgi:Ca-activated chloride channel family protein